MPIIKSAIKRMKQTIKRRDRNVGIKKDIKGATKAFAATPSQETLSKAQSELDKAVKKGLIKKNTASRRKAGLAKTAKAAGVKPAKASTKGAAAEKKPATTAKKTVAKAPAAKTATKATAKKPAAKKAAK